MQLNAANSRAFCITDTTIRRLTVGSTPPHTHTHERLNCYVAYLKTYNNREQSCSPTKIIVFYRLPGTHTTIQVESEYHNEEKVNKYFFKLMNSLAANNFIFSRVRTPEPPELYVYMYFQDWQ